MEAVYFSGPTTKAFPPPPLSGPATKKNVFFYKSTNG